MLLLLLQYVVIFLWKTWHPYVHVDLVFVKLFQLKCSVISDLQAVFRTQFIDILIVCIPNSIFLDKINEYKNNYMFYFIFHHPCKPQEEIDNCIETWRQNMKFPSLFITSQRYKVQTAVTSASLNNRLRYDAHWYHTSHDTSSLFITEHVSAWTSTCHTVLRTGILRQTSNSIRAVLIGNRILKSHEMLRREDW